MKTAKKRVALLSKSMAIFESLQASESFQYSHVGHKGHIVIFFPLHTWFLN